MKKLISKAGRAVALIQAVVFAGFFAISSANALMPEQPKPLWQSETADDAKVAQDARRDQINIVLNVTNRQTQQVSLSITQANISKKM